VWPSGTTVLLVDDEKDVTQALCLLLHDLDLVVLQAQSAGQALDILRRRKVDVVVSDERMPGMCGSEFLAIVFLEFPNTGRVILTGHATVEAAVRSINEGKVCRFLQKPCRPETFRAAIDEALRTISPGRTTPAGVGGFDPQLLATLSLREREVFGLIVDGLRISQIAEALFISPHTARNHLKMIFEKLDVHSQTEVLDRTRGHAGGTRSR